MWLPTVVMTRYVETIKKGASPLKEGLDRRYHKAFPESARPAKEVIFATWNHFMNESGLIDIDIPSFNNIGECLYAYGKSLSLHKFVLRDYNAKIAIKFAFTNWDGWSQFKIWSVLFRNAIAGLTALKIIEKWLQKWNLWDLRFLKSWLIGGILTKIVISWRLNLDILGVIYWKLVISKSCWQSDFFVLKN